MGSESYDNAKTTIMNILESIDIEIASDLIEAELEKHPDIGSLLAIADVLNYFKIQAYSYRIKAGEIDEDNPLVNKLCSATGNINCNAILSSKASKIFNVVSWSEVGFFYFGGTLILLFMEPNSLAIPQLLILLNLISLPYTFFSIFYQANVARQWCLLCCAIQLLLSLEFIPLINSFHMPLQLVNFTEASRAIIAFLLPIIIWIAFNPHFIRLKQLAPLKQQLHKFKYNTEFFNALLSSQPLYQQSDEEWSIVLGSADASNVITMVANPYCMPCAKMHILYLTSRS